MSPRRLGTRARVAAASAALLVTELMIGPTPPATPAAPSGADAARSAVAPAIVAPADDAQVSATAVRRGFSDRRIARLSNPTAIAFTHDGRMLITQQQGLLRVYRNGRLLSRPALDLRSRTCSDSERGLLGVAVDPRASSRYVYVFWTRKGSASSCPSSTGRNPAGAPRNRVSRFTLRSNNTIDPASELVLLDGIYASAGNHNAGDLNFGKDGLLYVSTGDGGCDYAGNSGCGGANDASRDRNILNGKILRITRTGSIPKLNPYRGRNSARCRKAPAARGKVCQETFARGLRNPFRFAFKPIDNRLWFRINDVGQNAWEEIDTGKKGADYGWNAREGHCANTGSASRCGGKAPSRYTDPVYDYGRSKGCGSITGGAYVPRGVWPKGYQLWYLFGDYVCGKIFLLKKGTLHTMVTGVVPVHLEFGPYGSTQALYYTSYDNGGEVRRLARVGTQPGTAAR